MATTEPAFEEIPNCWDCGAANDGDAPRCWLCGRDDWRRAAPGATPRWQGGPGPKPPAAPGPPRVDGHEAFYIGPEPDKSRFNLAALMLVIALVAVLIGIAREAPGLAVMLGVAAVPALAITARRASRRRRDYRPMTAVEKIGVFVGSTLVSLLVLAALAIAAGVALVIALFLICLASGEKMNFH